MCWSMPLEIHWNVPVNIHWKCDNPLDNATEKVTMRWKLPLEIRWKLPLRIHDDFRGVDFWRAVFRPYLRTEHFPEGSLSPG